MENLTINQELNKVLIKKEFIKPVNAVLINTPIVEVMEKVDILWPYAHKDAKLMAELAIATDEADGFNVINVPFDMVVESEALGCEVVWPADETGTPQVKSAAFRNIDDIRIEKDILNKGRFKVVLEAIKYIKKNYKKDISIIPFVDGPFTSAAQSIGINKLFKIVLKNEERARGILELFNDLCTDYACAQMDNGADFIMVLDPIVSGLSGDIFKRLLVPLYKKFNGINKKTILHICGNVNRIVEHIPLSGFNSFSFDHPAMNFEDIKTVLGDSMKIVGAIPTIDTLLEGSSKDVYDKTIECLDKGVDIIAPSCCIPPEVKLENLKAVMTAIKSYNQD